MTGKKKGNCLMKLLKLLMGFCLFIVIVVIMNTETNTSNDIPAASATVKPKATETITATPNNPTEAPTATPTTAPTATPTVAPTATVSKMDIGSVKTILKESLAGFSYSSVSGDETGFNLIVAMDGLAADVAFAKASGKPSADWVAVRRNAVLMCNSTASMLKNFGYEEAVCSIFVVNDNNHDDALLIVVDGQIIFDCMDM